LGEQEAIFNHKKYLEGLKYKNKSQLKKDKGKNELDASKSEENDTNPDKINDDRKK